MPPLYHDGYTGWQKAHPGKTPWQENGLSTLRPDRPLVRSVPGEANDATAAAPSTATTTAAATTPPTDAATAPPTATVATAPPTATAATAPPTATAATPPTTKGK